MDEKLEQAIMDIVGKDNLTRNIIDLVSYSCDASEHSHRPLCAVFAETTEQIADIMKNWPTGKKFPSRQGVPEPE